MIQPDNTPYSVRPAVLHDLDTLVAIDAKCFPLGIAYPRAEIAALLHSRSVLTLVAEMQKTIVGFTAVGHLYRQGDLKSAQRTSWYGELITLDVLPEFRRAGVGRQLHQAMEDWLRAGNAQGIQLHVAIDNTAALNFYGRMGYRKMVLIQRYYLNAIDAWQMGKTFA